MLKGLVPHFYLGVALRMIGSRNVVSDAQGLPDLLLERVSEFPPAVRQKYLRHTKGVEVCQDSRCDVRGLLAWDSRGGGMFLETVRNYHDVVVLLTRCGDWSKEITMDTFPTAARGWQRDELCRVRVVASC
jgi:hypothetical protein